MKKLWKKIREAIYRVLDKLIDDNEEWQDEEEAEPKEEEPKKEPKEEGTQEATDSGDAVPFADLDGKWRGGKFDWISTSRRTRSFANIHAGYHGWDSGAIERADAYAFVIVSKNGKRRTNVIAQGV